MYINEELENSPLFYYSVGLTLIIATIYGLVALFTGAFEKGAFVLTISALFYAAIYYSLFTEDSYLE